MLRPYPCCNARKFSPKRRRERRSRQNQPRRGGRFECRLGLQAGVAHKNPGETSKRTAARKSKAAARSAPATTRPDRSSRQCPTLILGI